MKSLYSLLAVASLMGAFALPTSALAVGPEVQTALTSDADLDGHIDFIFSVFNPAFASVDYTTVTTDDFTVLCDNGLTYAVTEGTSNFNSGYNLILAESDALDSNATCTVTYGVSGPITEMHGAPISGTDAIGDGASPALLTSHPTNGATITDLFTALTFTYSEDILPSTVNSSTVYIQEVSSTVEVNGPVVTIHPDSALTIDTAYHTVVSTFGLSDAAGNVVIGGTQSFVTAAPSGRNHGYIAPHLPEGTTPDNVGSTPTDAPAADPVPTAPEAPVVPEPEVLGDTDMDLSAPDANGVKAGDYIRGTTFPGVYFISDDLVRHPFIDEQTYFTYQDSWDGVIVLADDQLADYQMGSVMLPKAGTVLVKIESASDVYALELNAENKTVLRKIPNEITAEYVFGTNWADYVIDISPAFFKKFVMGSEIDTSFPVDMHQMKTRSALNNH